MGARLRSRWQQIQKHRVTIVVGAMVFVAVIALIIAGYWFDWTGFNGYNKVTITHTISGTNAGTVTRTEEYQPGKGLWDWLQLIGVLAIPVVVGFGAVWFTIRQGKVADSENTDNQRETALQAYLDKMSELLLKEHLGELLPNGKADQKYRQQQKGTIKDELKPEYEQVRNVARVRTITLLTQLNARRVGYAFAFLRESGLMLTSSDNNVVSLKGADLRTVNWSGADLSEANLSGADLSEANLSGADLSGANLSKTYLRGTDLFQANLSGANLSGANLSGANLLRKPYRSNLYGTDLNDARVSGANLFQADLSEADLSEADLSGANLSRANLSRASLNEAKLMYANLRGAGLMEANLREARLYQANLSGANLSGAGLWSADLSGTNLGGAYQKGATGITIEQLEKQAKSLKGTTMPDGSIHS